MAENRELKVTKRRCRFDAQVAVELRARVRVDVQGVALPAASVQREHQLAPKALPVRVLGDQRLELGHQRGVPSAGEVGVDSSLEGPEPKLVQACDLGLCERLVREVGQRRAAPERECVGQRVRGLFDVAALRVSLGFFHESFEAIRVDMVRRHVEDVASVLEEDRVAFTVDELAAERLPQARDVRLERAVRRLGRVIGPEVVDQPTDRHDLLRVQGEDRQERSLSPAADRDRPPFLDDVEAAEKPNFHATLPRWNEALQVILKRSAADRKRSVR